MAVSATDSTTRRAASRTLREATEAGIRIDSVMFVILHTDKNCWHQLTNPPHTTGIDTISDARPARVFGVVYEMKTEPEVGVRTAVSQYENMLLWRSGKHREHAQYFNRRANLELKEPFLGTC